MARLPPSRIVGRAVAALNELRAYATWQRSLDAGKPDPDPLLVRTLAQPSLSSRPLFDFYIVSVRRGPGISARFAHHADTGDFLEAEAVRNSGGVLQPYADAIKALGARLTDPDRATYEVVWRPCDQSTSRFLPFRLFYINGKPVYVRADGVVFDQLTFGIRG